MRSAFFAFADVLLGARRGAEALLVHGSGEQTDFVSINSGRVRQAGRVERFVASVRLVNGGRHASMQLALSGDGATDALAGTRALEQLRGTLPPLPPDPWLVLPDTDGSSETAREDTLPPTAEMVSDFLAESEGDVVGMLATGTLSAGFASCAGQRNWFQRPSYALDWTLHAAGCQPVKQSLSGFAWDPGAVRRQAAGPAGLHAALRLPPRALAPGRFRAYLEPAAVGALLALAGKDGFSARAWRKGTGCFSRAVRGQALSPLVTWRESPSMGAGPPFDRWGFRKPEVVLFERGLPGSPLVSPRSAAELGLACTGAGEWEQPESLVMEAGELPAGDALRALGSGVWISHLHYLNPTDFAAGRFTGLTRFATMWVEGGEAVHPIEVTRINESFLDLFGGRLLGLTRERASLLDTSTMDGRSTRTCCVPGALVADLALGA